MKYIASVSFGKDSLAMLLRLVEEKEPLDEVIFYDTGMEFNAIYNIRDKIKKLLEKHNIKFTELKPKNSFLYDMFEREVKSKNGTTHKGYSWCGGRCRWGTTAKQTILDRVSCWCCANKNLKELKNYYLHLPQYWQKLKDLQSKTNRPFKSNIYSINDLEQRFKEGEEK